MPLIGPHFFSLQKKLMAVLLALLLFCSFLGYLGLRLTWEQRTEQKKLLEQNLRDALHLAVRRVENGISDTLKTVLSRIENSGMMIRSRSDSLSHILAEYPFVDLPFLFDRSGLLVYPRAFLHPSNSGVGRPDAAAGELTSQYLSGDAFESKGEYEQALRVYRTALRSTGNVSEISRLLCRIARCERRLHHDSAARACYERILRDEHLHFNGDDLPPVVVAYTSLLDEGVGRTSGTDRADLLAAFARLLFERFDRMDRDQYEFYLERIHSFLAKESGPDHPADSNRMIHLNRLEDAVRRENQLAGVISNVVTRSIRAHAPVAPESPVLAVSDGLDADAPFYFAWWKIHDESKGLKHIGCRFRSTQFLHLVRDLVEGERVDSGWTLSFLADRAEVSSVAIPVFFKVPFERFQAAFPGAFVGMVYHGGDPFESISVASTNVATAIVVGIFAFLLTAVIALLREFRREQELTKLKASFIANVSHEIKTPITTIRALTENLTEGWIHDRAREKEYLALLAQESERASFLVSNILDFSRIEAGMRQYRFTVEDTATLLHRTIERFESIYDHRTLDFQADIPAALPPVLVDGVALEQALMNLLDNAVKYSPVHARIRLSAEESDDRLIISVNDNGIGISSAERKKIFRRFYRVPNGIGPPAPGSGIGLSLVKEIIDAHGGTISVRSRVGEGSVFTIMLAIHRT